MDANCSLIGMLILRRHHVPVCPLSGSRDAPPLIRALHIRVNGGSANLSGLIRRVDTVLPRAGGRARPEVGWRVSIVVRHRWGLSGSASLAARLRVPAMWARRQQVPGRRRRVPVHVLRRPHVHSKDDVRSPQDTADGVVRDVLDVRLVGARDIRVESATVAGDRVVF